MKNFKNLLTYYITETAAEYDAGQVVWDSEINLDVLDHFISLRCPFPANTCGKTEAWTTDSALTVRNEDEVEVIYISPGDLNEAGCSSLYEYVFGEDRVTIQTSNPKRFTSVMATSMRYQKHYSDLWTRSCPMK